MRTFTTAKSSSNTAVFQWWDYPLFICLTCLKLVLMFSFVWSWFSFQDWLHYPLSFLVMTGMLFFVLLNNQTRWLTLPYMQCPSPIMARPGWKVAVVTTFVPGAEPFEMLEETVRALVALDYPHDTWILDEGDTDQVKALCHTLGVHHFSRKTLSHLQTAQGTFQAHSKHGNYNAWLYEIGFNQYEIMTAFDPDHVPEPRFLTQVLGYFDDPHVGYVQTAQAYYNQQASFIARGAAEETYAYYSSMQMASYGMGVLRGGGQLEPYQMPQLIGSHNTHRVAALKQIGGLAPHDADDLLATLLYWVYAWQGIYVPRILARGLAPVDWHGYLTQQRRWARAILDLKFHLHTILRHEISVQTRLISVLHGLSYVHKSLLIPTWIILTACMLVTGHVPAVFSYPAVLKFAVLGAILACCELYRQRFYLDWRNECGLHWRAWLLQFAKWPYVILALYDAISQHKFSYVLTKKVKTDAHHSLVILPNACIFFFVCAFFLIGIMLGHTKNTVPYVFASIIAAISLALILLGYWHFPDPYDKKLRHNSHKLQA